MSDTSKDLIAINGVNVPDVKKGTLTVGKLQQYSEIKTEDGGEVIDITVDDFIQGSVTFSGLQQSELQTIDSAVELVSELTIYNPYTGQASTIEALVTVDDSNKIIHDDTANAWSYGFKFKQIGWVQEDD